MTRRNTKKPSSWWFLGDHSLWNDPSKACNWWFSGDTGHPSKPFNWWFLGTTAWVPSGSHSRPTAASFFPGKEASARRTFRLGGFQQCRRRGVALFVFLGKGGPRKQARFSSSSFFYPACCLFENTHQTKGTKSKKKKRKKQDEASPVLGGLLCKIESVATGSCISWSFCAAISGASRQSSLSRRMVSRV